MSGQNHSTWDSHVVPHHGTSQAALWLTAQIKRDAVLSESYGRGCGMWFELTKPLCITMADSCAQQKRAAGGGRHWKREGRKVEVCQSQEILQGKSTHP